MRSSSRWWCGHRRLSERGSLPLLGWKISSWPEDRAALRRGERGRQLRWPAGHRRPCSLARPAAGPAGASAGAGARLRRRGSRLWRSAGWSSSCSASQPSSSWRAVVIASDRVGAITSLSPAHGMGGTVACLGSNDIWVSRVAWKDLTPGRAPADLRSLDADALHRSPPRPLAREAFNAGKPAFKRLSRDRRLTAPRAIGARVRGVGQLGKWSDRAPAPAGPGGSTVARRPASACWCPRAPPGSTASRNGVGLPAELEPRLSEVERLPAPCRLREPKPRSRPGLPSLLLLVVTARESAPGFCCAATRRRSPVARWCVPP